MVKVVKNFVKVNQYTRPGLKLAGVKGIVMHWTATPGASALNERNYFNGTCIADKRMRHPIILWIEKKRN
ncbi:hypothetical protein [Bacillus swezeyi]|uniref:hypothetical protein n=1 Tax=Bacillus swezeyi TaxID=1925020 RepID=UPI0039C5FC2C